MTQCERVLDHLQAFGSLTAMEALSELGVFRLASRISELKKDGYDISKKMVSVTNRFGEECHVAEYTIKGC